MKTVMIEAEILEVHENSLRVRLLTGMGDPIHIVSNERVIQYEPVEEPLAALPANVAQAAEK